MPSLNLTFGQAGPLVQVSVGVSAPHRDALLAAGRPVPPLVSGTFLIDTGASSTCLDPALVAPLNLTPTGVVPIQTPSTAGTPHPCYQYDVMLAISAARAGGTGFFIDALPVLETGLGGQGIDGLIGRDVLAEWVLIYNGPTNALTLSY
jgi:hypothetical protein